MREFFEAHPRIRVAFLAALIVLSLVLLVRTLQFGMYVGTVVILIGLPAMAYSLWTVVRSGALRRRR